MTLVFVSYSRTDDAFVRRLVDDLSANGVNVWWDQRDITAGQRWDMAIERALDEATHVLFVMSKSSTRSDNVRDELDTAIDEGKVIVPVLIDDCKPPLRTRRMQYTDFRKGYDQGLVGLLAMLGVETPVPSTVQPVPVSRQAVPIGARTGGKTLAVVAALILLGVLGVGAFAVLRGGGSPGLTSSATSGPTMTQGSATTKVAIVSTRLTTTSTATATMLPTATAASAVTATPLPTETTTPASPADNSCPGALPPRLTVNTKGRVIPGGEPNNVRSQPGQNGAKIAQIDPGEMFVVQDGPKCTDKLMWWQVNYNGQIGWTAEGNNLYYWLEPLDPFPTFMTNLKGWAIVRGPDGLPSAWHDASRDQSKGIAGTNSTNYGFYLSADGSNDFIYEGDITLTRTPSGTSAAGLAFRIKDDPFTSGYGVNMTLRDGGHISLLSFPAHVLVTYKTPIKEGDTHHLKVVASGSTIQVYLDHDTAPILNTTDSTYTGGRFGLNVYQSTALFQNVFVQFK